MAVVPTKPPVGGAQLAAVLAALVDEASASAFASSRFSCFMGHQQPVGHSLLEMPNHCRFGPRD
jgi:hypothetical protein